MVSFEVLVSALMSLMVLSFLYKENPIYRLVEYISVSTMSAVLFITAWSNIEKWGISKLGSGEYIYLIGVILGLSLYSRFYKKYEWLGRYGISVLSGVGFGLTLTGTIKTSIIEQIVATGQSPIFGVPIGTAISSIILITVTSTIVIYFTYTFYGSKSSTVQDKPLVMNIIILISRACLMIAFGTMLGNMISDRSANVIDVLRRLLAVFGLGQV
jgi:hypothetical protein